MATENMVELIVTGQVGLNLQATKTSTGAFVDSFYRGLDGEGREIILPAESTLGLNLLGAIISSVNGQDVTGFQAMTVCQIISKANRPLTLKFLTNCQSVEEPLEMANYAALPWLLEHLEELAATPITSSKSASVDITLLKEKFLCYIDCKRILENFTLFRNPQKGKHFQYVQSLLTRFPETSTFISPVDNLDKVAEITSLLGEVVSQNLILSFVESISMKRMRGYLFNFPSCRKLALVDVLNNRALSLHFFMFLSRSNRRHILLVCYLQLMEEDLQVDTLSNLILCSSALDLCKEPSLQTLRDRLELLINTQRTPQSSATLKALDTSNPAVEKSSSLLVSNFREDVMDTLSDVMDCIAWEYNVTVYPSFEMSKDCTVLHSNITSKDVNSSEDVISDSVFHLKEGSLNELLRTRKLPNSLTVHRRVKTYDCPSKIAQLSQSVNVAIFDTYVNELESSSGVRDLKVVMADVTEDESLSAQVKVRGLIKAVNFSGSKPAELASKSETKEVCDGLRILSPFFVPTGKITISHKNTSNQTMDNQQPPMPKVYSMVLTARDQTPIYACSLVLYRPVSLVKNYVADDYKTEGPFSVTKERGITNEGERDGSNSSTSDHAQNAVAKIKSPVIPALPEIRDNVSTIVRTDGKLEEKCTETINPPNISHFQGDEDICLAVAVPKLTSDDISSLQIHPVVAESQGISDMEPVISDLTAPTPALDSLLSTCPTECLSSNIRSPTENDKRPNGEVRLCTSFSDDESAGLISTINLASDVVSGSPSSKIPQNDSRPANGSARPHQGSFSDFLNATANATASVASAIVLQAGSLPTSSFAWTANLNANLKANEAKGFYDNLSFSRFKTMHFANTQVLHEKNSDTGSNLKRKFDSNIMTESLMEYKGKVVAAELSLLHTSPSAVPLVSTLHTESPHFNFTSPGREAFNLSWNFSPDKPSLSSYPRFGAQKLSKKFSASPHTPCRSPGRRNGGHGSNRKSRSISHSTSRISHLQSSKRIVSEFDTTTEADFDAVVRINTADTPLDFNSVTRSINLSADDVDLATNTDKSEYEAITVTSPSHSSVTVQKGIEGMAYVAYGFALLTESPLIEKLGEVASAIASDFEGAYVKDGIDCDVPFVNAQSDSNLCHLFNEDNIASLKNLKVSEEISASPVKENFNVIENVKDYNSAIVFDGLSPKNLVTVLIAFLLEYRIVTISSRSLSASTHLGEWLKDAIYPLKYSHVYSPLVPPSIGLQLIHCPAPFFIGMKRSSKIEEIVESEDERDREKSKGRRGKSTSSKDSNCGLLLVDLDRDECSMPQDLCFHVRSARVLIRALENLLRPHLCSCDDVSQRKEERDSTPSVIAEKVLQLCRRFIKSILEGSKSSCLHAEDGDEHVVLFDELLFLQQHITRFSYRQTPIVKNLNIVNYKPKHIEENQTAGLAAETRKRSSSVDIILEDEDTSLLPSTVGGSRDIEKLLRCLMRTQSFSAYLTS